MDANSKDCMFIRRIIHEIICNFILLDSENTSLHYAAANGFSEGYYCLLQHGTSQLVCDNDGKTPLEVARKHGKFNAIKKAGICLHKHIMG